MLIQSPTEFTGWAELIQRQGPYLVLAILFGWFLFKLVKQKLEVAQAEASAARERERQALDEYKQEIKILSDKRERDLEAKALTAAKYAEDLKRVSEATSRGMEELAGAVKAMAREIIQEVRDHK
jgi:hypothetical protein